MKKFDEYPRTLKKLLRYIKQEATPDQLDQIEKMVRKSIELKRSGSNKTGKTNRH
jgi:hypothetical protein